MCAFNRLQQDIWDLVPSLFINIVGDFEGNQFFVIDGSSLVYEITRHKSLDWRFGGQYLQVIALLESTLKSLHDRDCKNFAIVWFNNHETYWKQTLPHWGLAKRIIKAHIEKNLKDYASSTTFDSRTSKEWVAYMNYREPVFVMLSLRMRNMLMDFGELNLERDNRCFAIELLKNNVSVVMFPLEYIQARIHAHILDCRLPEAFDIYAANHANLFPDQSDINEPEEDDAWESKLEHELQKLPNLQEPSVAGNFFKHYHDHQALARKLPLSQRSLRIPHANPLSEYSSSVNKLLQFVRDHAPVSQIHHDMFDGRLLYWSIYHPSRTDNNSVSTTKKEPIILTGLDNPLIKSMLTTKELQDDEVILEDSNKAADSAPPPWKDKYNSNVVRLLAAPPTEANNYEVVRTGKRWNPLYIEQTYMRHMHRYAASLVGSDQLHHKITVIASREKPAKKVKESDNQAKKAKEPDSKAKKITKAEAIIAENQRRKNSEADLKSQQKLQSLMRAIKLHKTSAQSIELFHNTVQLDTLTSTAAADARVLLMELYLAASKENGKDSKKMIIELLDVFWQIEDYSVLSKDLRERICGMLQQLGFTDMVAQMRKLGSSSSSAAKIDASPGIEFQLKYCGPWMKRGFEQISDDRVRFKLDGWQKQLLDIVDRGESALVCAPTSSGKTFASYYVMEKVLRESDEGVVVYVAPTKALTNQVAAEIYARFHNKNYKSTGRSVWGIYTRDYQVREKICQVLVTVPEVLEILFLTPEWEAWRKTIKAIVFDEVHCIGQEDQATAWERTLLMAPCPIIALSATIGNPDQFTNWLKTAQEHHGYKFHLVVCDYRWSDLHKCHFRDKDSLAIKDRLVHINPLGTISLAKLQSEGLPSDMLWSPEECYDVYTAMRKLTAKHECSKDMKGLSPLDFFKDDCLRITSKKTRAWGDALRGVIVKWAQQSPSTLELARSLLSGFLPPISERINDATPEGAAELGNKAFSLCKTLQQLDRLPAIFFCLNRHLCNMTLQHIVKSLEDQEAAAGIQQAIEKLEERLENMKLLQERKEGRGKNKPRATKGEAAMEVMQDSTESTDEMRTISSEIAELKRKHTFMPLNRGNVDAAEVEEILRPIKRKMTAESPYTKALYRGVGIHHAGMSKKYQSVVEILFRNGYLRMVIATDTLALGINMPCKTVVFLGDSVFVNALNYRQMSGRAARRGLDNFGQVVFLGMSHAKIRRLMTSQLPSLQGSFPLSVTFVAQLLLKYNNAENKVNAMSSVQMLLRQPLLYLGSEHAHTLMPIFFTFASQYLYRAGLIDQRGRLNALCGLVTHLTDHEPASLHFVALYQSGVLHDIVNECKGDEEETSRQLLLIFAYLFTHLRLPLLFNPNNERVKKSLSTIEFLPINSKVIEVISKHDEEAFKLFTDYARICAKPLTQQTTVQLPLSKIEYKYQDASFKSPITSSDAISYSIRSPFMALSGKGDQFSDTTDLASMSWDELFLEPSSMPLSANSVNSMYNAYAYDFYLHGKVDVMEQDNGLNPGEVWKLLQEFSLAMAAIVAALTIMEQEMKDLPEEMTEVRRPGKLLQALIVLTEDYQVKFKKTWA